MNKVTIAVLLLSFSTSAFACLGEAQLIAQVGRIEKTMTSCRVYPDANEIRFYSPSVVCPLFLVEMINEGIEVGLLNGHDCSVEGDINGVVVRDSSGKLVLE